MNSIDCYVSLDTLAMVRQNIFNQIFSLENLNVVGAQAWLPHNKDGAQTDREYRDLTRTHELTNT